MDDTVILILLVIVMLVGSYMAGSIPLVVSLSEVITKVNQRFESVISISRISCFFSGMQ